MINALQVVRNASSIELLLPGGSLIALLLWLFRRRFKKEAGPDRAFHVRVDFLDRRGGLGSKLKLLDEVAC